MSKGSCIFVAYSELQMRKTLKPLKSVLFSLQFWHILKWSQIADLVVLCCRCSWILVSRCRVVTPMYEIFASRKTRKLHKYESCNSYWCYVASVIVLYRCLYSDDVGHHDQRNVNKNNKAFKIKLAVTMTSPEERHNQSYKLNCCFHRFIPEIIIALNFKYDIMQFTFIHTHCRKIPNMRYIWPVLNRYQYKSTTQYM